MDPAEQLQRIYLAGFDLETFDRFPKCVGVVRDGCIALLVPGLDGMQILGTPGWRMGEAIGVLVERNGQKIFQYKQEIVEAIELGVRGVLLKSAATQLLIESIRAVMLGSCWEGTRSVPSLNVLLTKMRKELNQRKFGLTARELDVASAVVRHSMANKDIAHFFKIAEDTVKKHISSIFDKLGVSNRLELDHFAREHKLPLRDLF